ncbi:MAG: flagellar biosynthesis protein FliQ [Lachnospiraceae bacterium]|nr:flagellar biosynthesis protein FliQ [Lachnospiraceae bacterium]
MTPEAAAEMIHEGLYLTLKCALPVLLVSMCIGLIISIFQTVTSIQEQTLTFVPKVLGIFLTLMFLGNWIMNNIVSFTTELWSSFVYYVHK